MKNIYVAFTLVFLLCFNIFSLNIFVNPTSGSDVSGTGIIGNPYKTIGKAFQFALGGDTVYVRGGSPNGTAHINIKELIRRRTPDNGWVYVRPYQSEIVILDGNNSSLIEDWNGIIRIESSKRISIKGFTIRKNNSQAPNSGGLGIFINSYDSLSKYITIDSCVIYEVRKSGILVQGSNTTVNNCEIYNAVLRNQNQMSCNWDQALSSYVDVNQPGHPFLNDSIIFSNNKIHNCWGEGIGIIRTDTFFVRNNEIYNCYSVYIYMDNSYNGEVNNNSLYTTDSLYDRTCLFTNYKAPANGIFWAAEGAGDYEIDRMVENIKIHNNFIYGTSPAFGWFHDSTNTFFNNSYRNIKIYYNTVYNIRSYESFYLEPVTVNIAPPTGCEFRNNIIPKGRYLGTTYNYFTPSQHFYQVDKWIFTNNCFIDAPIPPQLPSGNNVQFDPSFVNPNNNNPVSFKLSPNSPLKDIGITIPGIIFDYWYAGRDNTPSIGFHEYGGVAVITPNGNILPNEFNITQNYPNPFNPITTINFDIPLRNHVKLTVYDVLGKEVFVLVNQEMDAGSYKVSWDASTFSSGVYFYKIETNSFSETKKMTLIK